jgi:hypothetical protein
MPNTPLHVPQFTFERSRGEVEGYPKILEVVLNCTQQPNQFLPKRFRSRLFRARSLIPLHI